MSLLGQDLGYQSGMDVDVHVHVGDLDADLQLAVYQVAREALVNAVKHSQAAHVSVVIEQERGTVLVSVEDDGRGLDSDDVRSLAHFGVQIMRERVALRGGFFRIDARPNGGTRVRARFPLT
jgi:two-component system nitrate/nitrite sensor histidine kinase NarQ